ncbi:MAG: transporter substrate-binding domain-containing protein [Clostridia bacterium]|nr:transporter substrate-binding domain-containing protein [Clostridia bacterium]
MKKVIALLVCLSLVFAFAACSGKTDDPTTTAGSAEDTAAAVPAESGVLRVAMEANYAPYNWTQSDDKNGAVPIKDSPDYAYGYDVMMAKYLADKMGKTVEIYKMDWSSIPLAVQAGTVDCAICGQSITAERLETVDFTTPYYYASIVVLVKADSEYAGAKGLSELDGASATSQLGTIWYDKCVPQIPNVDAHTAIEEVPNMITALRSGDVDVVVTDAPTAMSACTSYNDLVTLNFTGTDDDFQVSDEDVNIGISVMKGNTELLDALNAGLATLTDDDFVEWMQKAVELQPLAE